MTCEERHLPPPETFGADDGMFVRPMGGYQLPEWIRISIGTPKENARCLEALKTVLGRN